MKKITTIISAVVLSVSAFATGHIPAITPTPASCGGVCDGSAIGSVTGGVGPFAYDWAGPSAYTGTGTTISSLCEGIYTLTVTDSADMSTATATATIIANPALVGSATSIVICNGDPSNIPLNSTVGGSTFTWTSAITLGNIVGNNSCASGCTTTISDVLTNIINTNGVVEYTVTPSSAGCAGSPFLVDVTIGVGPATPVISGPATLCGMSTATYSIAALGTGVSCAWTVPNGLTITSGQGTTSITASIASGATSGYITCTAADNCGTSAIDSFLVTINGMPDIGPDFTVPCGAYTYSLSTPSVFGAISYTWVVTDPGASIVSGQGTTSVTVTSPVTGQTGTFAQYVIVIGGTCSPASDTSYVTISGPVISLTSVNATCAGTCDGSISSMVSGGNLPYAYLWNQGSTTTSIPNLCTGNYSLTVTDANGCGSMANAFVNQNSSIPISFSMVPDSVNGYMYSGFNSTIGAGLTYNWDFGDGGSSAVASPVYTYSTTGSFNVCLYAFSGGGCYDSVCHLINVTGVANTCNALFNIAHDTSVANPNAYTITNLSYGTNLTYLWDFGDTTSSTAQHPTHTYANIGPYQLCLTVDNGAGCTSTFCDSLFAVDSLHTHLQPISFTVVGGPGSGTTVGVGESGARSSEMELFPNPSASGVFQISSFKFQVSGLKVFNVLGEMVYSSSSPSGKLSGTSINLSSFAKGIYFVEIQTEISRITKKLVIE